MKIAIFGTGMVGSTIGTKLVSLGHEVKMGSRTAGNAKATAWVEANGKTASQGTFADAAAFGEIAFNCTAGVASVAAIEAAGPKNLAGKILVDVSNPLDFSKGMPPTLSVCNGDSTAEQLQRACPDAKVVKALNTMNCTLMVDPSLIKGEHDVFLSGNDAAAKGRVTEILKGWFGWKNVVDLGDLTAARGQEMFVILWVRVYGALQSPNFNIHIAR
ncbi:MAG TPA: NAD(P)-binding domain-containing protein [Polyangia bacterium]|jgi:predicted dinucleotide-binding enzyme|nr:NAD(P)-binding domain-containing protein [Polyangia bacterium]